MPTCSQPRDTENIAYLTGLYPAISHTFVLREVLALRATGVQVMTCSVNRPHPSHIIGPDEQAAAESTFYLLSHARQPLVLLGAIGQAMVRPRRLARALSIVGQSRGAGVKATCRQLIYLLEAMVLARFLKHCKATRIHNQLGMASASVSMYASILAGIPFSFSLHGPDDFYEENAWQMATKIALADVVACISKFCRQQARALCSQQDWGKLHIVRCGIDPSLYQETLRTPPLRRILFVGRLVPVKGVSVLIDAFSRIADAYPDATLTIVGDGAERRKLEDMSNQLGLEERVFFTGALNQHQVAVRMSEADLFVLPSFAEGLPVVLMEAMASGLPVIATNVAGTPELVENGVTGQLVDAGNVEQLAQVIACSLANHLLAREMARRGRVRALENHSMWEEAGRLSGLFESVRLNQDIRHGTILQAKPPSPI